MPEHLRALVVILVIATTTFLVAHAPLTTLANRLSDYERRRNLWLSVTTIAFLAHEFWLYVIATALLLALTLHSERNRLALFFLLVPALPRISATIPGLGFLNALFDVDHLRLLALVLLLPTFVSLLDRPTTAKLGSLWPDRFLLAYLGLHLVLALDDLTFTAVLREHVFYSFTDTFLPYYIASRSLTNLKAFRDALAALVVSGMVLGMVLLFELLRGWLLYTSLSEALGTPWGFRHYHLRGSNLRGVGSVGQPIAAGCVMAVVFGVYQYVGMLVSNKNLRMAGGLVLIAGLIGALSRGPWLQAAITFFFFIALGPQALPRLLRLGASVVFLLPVLLLTKTGQSIIDHLPWIGTLDAGSVDGRANLFEVASQVILDNAWFGRHDFLLDPRMELVRGGDGIIDIVNTYLQVGLQSGLVGLTLFASFFVSAGYSVFAVLKSVGNKADEHHVLGRMLLATLLGLLFVISTVSFILLIPLMCWAVAGLAVGFAQMTKNGLGAMDRDAESGTNRITSNVTRRRKPPEAALVPRTNS